MRNYSYVSIWVAVLVLALAVTAFANGATHKAVMKKPVQSVKTAPVSPAGTGKGAVTTTKTPQKCYTMDQLVTLTVAQSWELSGRNYGSWSQIVQAMADMSARNRGLDIPNTREAGMEIGRLVRQGVEADSNRLLYSVVDNAVVQYASIHGLTPVSG